MTDFPGTAHARAFHRVRELQWLAIDALKLRVNAGTATAEEELIVRALNEALRMMRAEKIAIESELDCDGGFMAARAALEGAVAAREQKNEQA
jgi:hypothetical protein